MARRHALGEHSCVGSIRHVAGRVERCQVAAEPNDDE